MDELDNNVTLENGKQPPENSHQNSLSQSETCAS